MSWENVRKEAMPLKALEYLVTYQFESAVGKFMLEIDILTGYANLWEWPQGEITVSGPIDELIEKAIEMYSADQFGLFACFLRKCKYKVLAVLYIDPQYSHAVRDIKLR